MRCHHASLTYTQRQNLDTQKIVKEPLLEEFQTRIKNLRYADDSVLQADNEEDLQSMVDKVNEADKLYNMKMNAKKTKTMALIRNENKPRVNIKVDGTTVEQVGSFNYLGQILSDDRRCVDGIKRELAKPHSQT